MSIQEKIKNWVKETLKTEGLPTQAGDFVLAHPKDIKNGDYSFFAAEHANEFGRALSENKLPEIKKIEAASNFVNFYLSKEFFANSVKEILDKGEKFGKNNLFNGEKTIIEFTDPNPFKQFHIGHLMSNTIGESISRIMETNNAELKKSNYQGDVGIHIACTLWGIKKNGGIKEGHIKEEIKYLGECYSLGAKALKENENTEKEIKEINTKLYEKSDKSINEIYNWGRKVSLDYFEVMYARLGTTFDEGFYFFESETGEMGKQIVLEFLKKGVFEKSDGAIIFRGENYDKKLHTRVFINSQGLPVYEAKELALAKIKYEKYPYDKSIVITGNEINEYFKVLMAAMKKIFPDLASKTKHLSHGMLRLPSGKMSSRTGDVITAESLIEQVKERILEKIKDRDFPEQEKNELAEIVAIGAIKYSILRQAIGGDIIFDFDKSISFEGDSGPYLQYTCVRANSVLGKTKESGVSSDKSIWERVFKNKPARAGGNSSAERPENFEITELEKYLYRFPEIVERAGREYAPHHIVTYLTELASVFNSFYATNRIIESPPARLASGEAVAGGYKIALTQAVAHILKSGLYLLGVKVPKRM
jgi:arginyl-tRNA synthetase